MYIVLPMVNRKGRTLGLIVLKEERVQSDTIRITNKSDRAIGAIFNIIFPTILIRINIQFHYKTVIFFAIKVPQLQSSQRSLVEY